MAQDDTLGTIATMLSVAVVLGAVACALLLSPRRPLTRLLLGALRRAHRAGWLRGERRARWRRRLVRELQRFTAGFGTFLRASPGFAGAALAATFVFLLALFSFPFVLLQALGHELDWLLVVGRTAATTLAMYFAPTPGASGVAEGAFAWLFSDLIPASQLVLVTVVWRALTIHLGMLIGLFAMQQELARTLPKADAAR